MISSRRSKLELQRCTIINSMYINFNSLASKYPKLYPHLVILDFKTTINFKSQESLILLAEAIMKCIFGIQFTCPSSNLCPRIPVRLNYLIWIHKFIPERIEKVMDIGTGATLIYPLIGASVFGWRFVATDINVDSLDHAKHLIEINKLEDKIHLFQSQSQQRFFELNQKQWMGNQIQFNDVDVVICNPPFYHNQQDEDQQHQQMQETRKEIRFNKTKENGRYCGPRGKMLSQEYACEGGEYNFFFNIYRQSFNHCSNGTKTSNKLVRSRYFSCLLGRLSSFEQICKFLKFEIEQRVLEVCKVGEIRQGANARFVVMWRPKVLGQQITREIAF